MVSLTRLFGVVTASSIFVLMVAIGMLSCGVGGGGCRLRSFFWPSLFGMIGNGNSRTTREHGWSAVGDDQPPQEDRTNNRGLVSEDSVQKRARVAYFIMSGGSDIGRLNLLLPAIYHPDNIYLVHVDAKANPEEVEQIREAVAVNFPAREGRPSNGRLLEPATIISWGGFSITLACLYGIAASLQWDDGWDYFVNLSAADFPVMTQEEIQRFLGEYAGSRTNFIDGEIMTGFEPRWKVLPVFYSLSFNRRKYQGYIYKGFTEDQGLQRNAASNTVVAMKLIGKIERPYPQLFDLYKGEFWVAVHRSFCEYVSWSPDNVARVLAAYFASYRISDESYFQTLACHPEGIEFPIVADNLRFTSWNEDHKDDKGRKVDAQGNILLHPEPLTMDSFDKIKASGALFARKFDLSMSYNVYAALQNELRGDADNGAVAAEARLERTRARVGVQPGETTGRSGFCGSRTWDESPRHRRMLAEQETPRRGVPSGGDVRRNSVDGRKGWNGRR